MQEQPRTPRAPAAGAWIFVTEEEIPERWRERASPVWQLALTPEEMRTLLEESALRPELSDTDSQVASLLAAGLQPAAIASRAGLSERTVRRRLARMRDQVGARSTAELSLLLARRGF